MPNAKISIKNVLTLGRKRQKSRRCDGKKIWHAYFK